ncbi:hypothetical protein MA16_Dca023111 [Dendrobium catenatum]|uniref:Uncharacterized protein n=1 Tax=Dendrobium catenatum TaxID=906689 RepID=A0A2I0VKV2_9ASPA|nr:hypothetical protein MA16_Dca023111 [Dendrobium catenatum]
MRPPSRLSVIEGKGKKVIMEDESNLRRDDRARSDILNLDFNKSGTDSSKDGDSVNIYGSKEDRDSCKFQESVNDLDLGNNHGVDLEEWWQGKDLRLCFNARVGARSSARGNLSVAKFLNRSMLDRERAEESRASVYREREENARK